MKYSKKLLYIDIALIFSFLPLFIPLPFLMKLYFFIGAVFIFLKKPYIKTLAFIGFLLFFLSFYQSFNFYGISRFHTFIIMLISLLEIGVILQRLKGVNFYLLISPILFLGLSIFIYQNIFMLFYSLFELLLFLYLILLYKLESLKEAFKLNFIVFLISLPFVVVLFLFSPRKSFFSSSFGFHQGYVVSGFGKRMIVSDNSVINSNQIVLEVSFSKLPKEFYFRGNVLYKNYGAFWGESYAVPKDILVRGSNLILYREKMYPTNEKYFFALDLPIEAFKGAFLTKYYTIKLFKPLRSAISMKLNSFTDYTLRLPFIPAVALEVNRNFNKLAQKDIKNIAKIKDKNKRLKALIKFFKSKKIEYTLKPPKMNPLNIVDELLYKKKKGYCVHFASAFAILARLVNLPSRVVTGFLGKEFYKDYMVVRAKDAHAWVEVYTNKWIRIDPVKFAYKINAKTNTINQTQQNNNKNKIKEDKSLFLMYLRFKIEEWILYYSISKQNRVINFIKTHKSEVIFVITGILFFIGIIIFYLLKCKNYECYMKKLIKKLEEKKERNSTIYEYLKSFEKKELDDINKLYHKLKFYKYNKQEEKELIKKIKGFK